MVHLTYVHLVNYGKSSINGQFSIIYWEESSQLTFIFFQMVKTTHQVRLNGLYKATFTAGPHLAERL